MGRIEAPDKLVFQANVIRTDETDSSYVKSQHVKGKEAEQKTKKMMRKSQSIKLSKLETSLRPSSKRRDQTGWQRTSPKRTSPLSTKSSSCGSPNYMKSTRSSEAKKEQPKVSVSGLSKLQRVAKTLSRMSSLKRVRTITRRNKYVQSGTCSSTQKESKFPAKLILRPGGTEAEGGSIVKVCSYNHCSLNKHECNPVPSLKSFLSSKRKLLENQKVSLFTPFRDQNSCECLYKESDLKVDESFSGTLVMEWKEGKISTTWSDYKGKVLTQGEKVDDYLKVFLEVKLIPYHLEEEWQNFSDVEFVSDCESSVPGEQQSEEPKILEEADHGISGQQDQTSRERFPLVDDATICYTSPEIASTDKEAGSFSEPANELTEGRQEFEENKAGNDAGQRDNMDLSDDNSVSDWNSIQTGEVQLKEPNIFEENEIAKWDSFLLDDSITCLTDLEIKSIEEQHSYLSDSIDETSEIRYEDGDEGNKERYTVGDTEGKADADITIAESELTDNTISDDLQKINDMGLSSIKEASDAVHSSEAESEQKESRNGAELRELVLEKLSTAVSKASEKQNDISTEKLNHCKNSFVEVKPPEMDGISRRMQLDIFAVISNRTRTTKHSCSKFKRTKRCKKTQEGHKKARGFNPRGPKFLPVEPDPEAERVALRHHEMDERRSAEEWMLDYALRKAIHRLASARRRKVTLLVEAFETVMSAQGEIIRFSP